MSNMTEQGMRTTLTIDDDIAAKLVSASRKSGKSFKEIVNAALRRGLLGAHAARNAKPLTVQPQKIGSLRTGISLDKISVLLDEADGAWRR